MSRKFSYSQDRVKELRMSVIESLLLVVKDDPTVDNWSVYKKEVISRMSPRVLPVLNAGREDDEPLYPKPIYNGKSKIKK